MNFLQNNYAKIEKRSEIMQSNHFTTHLLCAKPPVLFSFLSPFPLHLLLHKWASKSWPINEAAEEAPWTEDLVTSQLPLPLLLPRAHHRLRPRPQSRTLGSRMLVQRSSAKSTANEVSFGQHVTETAWESERKRKSSSVKRRQVEWQGRGPRCSRRTRWGEGAQERDAWTPRQLSDASFLSLSILQPSSQTQSQSDRISTWSATNYGDIQTRAHLGGQMSALSSARWSRHSEPMHVDRSLSWPSLR